MNSLYINIHPKSTCPFGQPEINLNLPKYDFWLPRASGQPLMSRPGLNISVVGRPTGVEIPLEAIGSDVVPAQTPMADTFATLHIDFLENVLDYVLPNLLQSVLRIEMSFEYRSPRSVAKWIAITGTL